MRAGKRFLILTQYFPPEIGASQARLAAFAIELLKFGHDVEVVTAMPHHLRGEVFPEYRRKLYLDEMWEGITVRRTWVYVNPSSSVSRRLANYFSFVLTCWLALARTRRPDYIVVESPPLFLAVPGATYSWLRKTPLILNVSDLWPDSVRLLGVMQDGLALRMAERLEHFAYKQARFLNAITDGVRHALISRKKVDPRKVLFFPNGVDTELFSPQPASDQLLGSLGLSGKQVILYAGTHGIAYRLDLLLDVAQRLKDSDVVFLLVGDGPTKRELADMVRLRNITNVMMLEPKPYSAMPQYFALARASIIPLKNNPLFIGTRPAKLFPSWACGIPVIYSGEGEGADLVSEAKAGIVVPPDDIQGMVGAVQDLVANESLRSELGSNGRRFVLERFSWHAIVGRWLQDLESRGGDLAR